MNAELQQTAEFDKNSLQISIKYYFRSRMDQLHDQKKKHGVIICLDRVCPICIEQVTLEITALIPDTLQKEIFKLDRKPKP